MASPKSTPKDAQVMSAILKDMGIVEYEPRVINQMLEFTYRYITNILDDARLFSTHAKKKALDTDDVKLAIQMQMDKAFTTPPPRDILIEIARQRNNIPLPLIKPHSGPRLPPDRYCLTTCNYRLKSSKKPSARQYQMGMPLSSIPTPKINVQQVSTVVTTVPKLGSAVSLPSSTGATLSLVTKGSTAPTVAVLTRPVTSVSSAATALPTPPIIKISAGLTNSTSAITTSVTPGSSPAISPSTVLSNSSVGKPPSIITQTVSASSTPVSPSIVDVTSGKRKREDDDYDVE